MVPWVGIQCVIMVVPDQTHFFIFFGLWDDPK